MIWSENVGGVICLKAFFETHMDKVKIITKQFTGPNLKTAGMYADTMITKAINHLVKVNRFHTNEESQFDIGKIVSLNSTSSTSASCSLRQMPGALGT